MNISKYLAALPILIIGVGCQSNRTHASNNIRTASPNADVTYTVESIPNPHLSATSREGDPAEAVYSSNIIAVYAHHRGDGTNSNVIAGQEMGK